MGVGAAGQPDGRTAGWPDRLTGVGRRRQAAGGGDGREEDEGAGTRHLVEDGREVEVVAAGEEGGGGPSAPSHGDPRDPGLPPAQERGRRRRTGGGRGCLLAQVPPSPSLKGQTDEGMERRTEERSWGARVAGVGGRG